MSAALAQTYDNWWIEHPDPVFDAANDAMARYFKSIVERFDKKLFIVDIGDINLFETYLGTFPEEVRQYHNCNTCRGFINKYGRLVTVDHTGKLISACWTDSPTVPELYRPAFTAMRLAVEKFGKIDRQFLSSQDEWGKHELGGYTHFALYPPDSIRYPKRATKTASQMMALARENHGTLSHALADYPREIVAQAVNLLQADALYRAEKVLGPAQFLLKLHDEIAAAGRDSRARSNLIWRAVANAPVGFCTPRGAMVGTLMDDIKAGKSVDVVAKGFASKMNPTRYQRPTAAPTAGNVIQAEKLVAQMGIAQSLRRRFARLEDLEALWLPKPINDNRQEPALSVFAGLVPKKAKPKTPDLEAPAQNITLEKFRRTVLPSALRIQAYIEPSIAGIALLTAADMDAPPIVQWDSLERRNPVSWYVYPRGDSPGRWNLRPYTWVEVNAITLQPSMWADEEGFAHQGKSAILVLEGARDLTPSGGNGLFPEILKSDLHQVRSTIEAHSRRTETEEKELATACGIRIAGKGAPAQTVLVTTALGKARYRIDRWD